MRVAPANQIPINMTWNGGKFVQVNLQKTPIDEFAEFVIHARIQTVMTKLMEKLEMPIPKFKLDRWANISLDKNKNININGIDKDGGPYTLFKERKAVFNEKVQN